MDFLRTRFASRSPKDTGRLDRFLSENELDALVPWRFESGTRDEQRRIRAIAADFEPLQAMYNLLQHPEMLPPDERFLCVYRAITQRDTPWLAIAGAVALQGWDREVFKHTWPDLRAALASLVLSDEPVVANRASVTLAGMVGPGDEGSIVDVLRQEPEHRELRNLLICLIRTEADNEVVALLPRVLGAGLFDAASEGWLEQWRSPGRRPATPPPPMLMLPGLSYIPNLSL